jgi:hypothetical protein
MPQFANPSSLAFIFIFVFLILLLIVGRRIIKTLFRPIRRLLGAVIRYVIAPIYNRTLRPLVRLFRQSAKQSPAAQRIQVGVAPLTAILHILEMNSAAQIALGEVPKSLVNLVHREGLFFRAVNANRVVDGVPDSLTLDDAISNVKSSEAYYAGVMTHDVSPSILYEESEEELLINILKVVDLSFFYVLRRINKNVGRNVIRVVAVMTGMAVVFPYFITALVDVLDLPNHATEANVLIYLLACASFILVIVLFRWAYSYSLLKNGFHFNYFVSTYFSRLANQYKSAAASFAGVMNDGTLGLDAVEKQSNVWFLNLQWLASRQWFLELFVRNTMFQIGRNLWWFTLVILLSFGAVWWTMEIGVPYGLHEIGPWLNTSGLARLPKEPQPSFEWNYYTVPPSALFFAVYLVCLSGLLTRFWGEIGSSGWLDFRQMDIKKLVEKNVGSLVRDLVGKRRNPYGQVPPAGPSASPSATT